MSNKSINYFDQELAKDCDRSVELGDIKQFTMDCFEQSMYNEYLKIAPTELYVSAVSDNWQHTYRYQKIQTTLILTKRYNLS